MSDRMEEYFTPIHNAAEFLYIIARASSMSKANCEMANQHAQEIFSALSSIQELYERTEEHAHVQEMKCGIMLLENDLLLKAAASKEGAK
ncbi:hypothetical protein CWR43_28065 [Rhizobium sullae]|uniref:Uncharacterized protein n=1 Tax=Rhizobium sullae TaxID=50338 RepID=A0A2N0D301_RHISU|nr:hypothetical protein [Rhizobium sullae]PKA40437.1 hypothetical protein CWR43_28065 [Rhizobium sullae]